MERKHTVWIWRDLDETPRHVGYGRFIDKHPALEVWEQRNKGDSELHLWLQRHNQEPIRENYGPRVVSLEHAIAAVLGLRERFKGTLLNTRGPSSYKGGHPARGVFFLCMEASEKSKVFATVREAADAMNVHPSTVVRWCKNEANASWGYLDESD